jgi:tricorn protease interacting factor F2/3
MMDTWVRQVGYPLIDAKLEGDKVALSQSRFLLEHDPAHAKGRWMVPISLMTREGVVHRLMQHESENFVIDSSEEWFKVNSGQKGFYRVRYPSSDMDMLKSMVDKKILSNSDRWGLHADSFALCVSGGIGLKSYLDFASAYFGETDYLVAMEAASSLYSVYHTCHGERFSEEVRQIARRYFHSLFDRLGWDPKKGERPNDAILRGFVIGALGKLGDQEVVEEAKRRFALYLKKPDTLSPNLRSPVFNLVAWSGAATQEKFKELYRKAKTQEEKIRFLGAMYDSQDEKVIEAGLNFALTDEVRTQDLYVPIAKSAANLHGKKTVWPWVKRNWKAIHARFGNASPLFNHIIHAAAMGSDMERASDVAGFFKKNPVPGTEMTVSQVVERTRVRARLLERSRNEFNQAF